MGSTYSYVLIALLTIYIIKRFIYLVAFLLRMDQRVLIEKILQSPFNKMVLEEYAIKGMEREKKSELLYKYHLILELERKFNRS